MKNTNLIGISGRLGHGKDVVGNIIQYLYTKKGLGISNSDSNEDFQNFLKNGFNNKSSWEVKKFADKLKNIVSLLIGCTREQLEDRDFKEKELGEDWIKYVLNYSDKYDSYTKTFLSKEEVDTYAESVDTLYYKNVYKVNLTPRLILQILGTEAGRGLIHPNIWVNSLMSEYKPNTTYVGQIVDFSKNTVIDTGWRSESRFPKWIVTDMRFSNELEAIKSRGGITIRVNRNIPKPESEHESETALDNAEFDHVIENNGTMDELIEKVRNILLIEKIL